MLDVSFPTTDGRRLIMPRQSEPDPSRLLSCILEGMPPTAKVGLRATKVNGIRQALSILLLSAQSRHWIRARCPTGRQRGRNQSDRSKDGYCSGNHQGVKALQAKQERLPPTSGPVSTNQPDCDPRNHDTQHPFQNEVD